MVRRIAIAIIVICALAAGCAREGSLVEAIQMGDLGRVERLVNSGVDVNAVDEFGRTPLHYAAMCGEVRATGMLLDAGAKTDIRDHNGRTPLLIAAGLGREEISQLLIVAGADVDLSEAGMGEGRGRTALLPRSSGAWCRRGRI
jgi:ankyrin repeat protein